MSPPVLAPGSVQLEAYPVAANFMRFFDKVNVETEPTEMTFDISRDHGLF